MMKKKCFRCNKLTNNWQSVNGSYNHCYDGCYSTTGRDYRTIDGNPAWLPFESKNAWDKSRLWENVNK